MAAEIFGDVFWFNTEEQYCVLFAYLLMRGRVRCLTFKTLLSINLQKQEQTKDLLVPDVDQLYVLLVSSALPK